MGPESDEKWDACNQENSDSFDEEMDQTEIILPARLHFFKGRGTSSSIAHRFSKETRVMQPDGWSSEIDAFPEKGNMPPVTQVRFEYCRSAISYNRSPDIPLERSVNPYRGCEHGCIYCYARPGHAYMDLSPGLDFETKLIARPQIATVLRHELSRPRYARNVQPIAIGTMTDCYQPIERQLRLTRQIIEVLAETRHPFSLITKSSAVERDLDLIAPLAQARLAHICITLVTLDTALARAMEPRAAAPHRRLRTIETLARAGVPVSVSLAPQIPFLTDDMEQVLEAARAAGASTAFYTVLRLPWEVATLFEAWLAHHYPQRAQRIMARIRELRGGKLNDSRFGMRMSGQGVWADLLRQRFQGALRRYGYDLSGLWRLDTSQFTVPSNAAASKPPNKSQTVQGELFDDTPPAFAGMKRR